MTKTILTTFAGRKDRMSLLFKYVKDAHDKGLIDEYHVWDFARNDDDIRWLSETFDIYYTMLPPDKSSRNMIDIETFSPSSHKKCLQTSTSNNTQSTAILNIDTFAGDIIIKISDDISTISIGDKIIQSTDKLSLDEFKLKLDKRELSIIQGEVSLKVQFKCDVTYNGVYVGGESIIWNSESWLKLCQVKRRKSPVFQWIDYYQHYYNHRLNKYKDVVLIKVDDDVVYFDVDELHGFIEHRKQNPQYYFTSANVINNGVCAHYQQCDGATKGLDLEYPKDGLQGTLWASKIKFAQLHAQFISNSKAFISPINRDVHTRISINFICFLSSDFKYWNSIQDDEHELSVCIPHFTKRSTCIYGKLNAAHLSFYAQESGNDKLINKLIEAYSMFKK